MLVLHVVYVEHLHNNGEGMEEAFPRVDFHTRWDITWQQPDHPAVLDWLNFESAQKKDQLRTEFIWETMRIWYNYASKKT